MTEIEKVKVLVPFVKPRQSYFLNYCLSLLTKTGWYWSKFQSHPCLHS